MITLYLVRHGEVENPNHVVYADLPGFDLSCNGVLQAHATGNHLANARLDAVISSPLERALHTAVPIAHRNDVAISVDHRLTETGMYPAWTGNRWEEVEIDHAGQLAGYLEDATVLSDVHETVSSIAARVQRVVADAIGSGLRRIAIVSHQDPIASARLLFLGSSLSLLRIDPPAHGSCTELRSSDAETWIETATWAPDPVEQH